MNALKMHGCVGKKTALLQTMALRRIVGFANVLFVLEHIIHFPLVICTISLFFARFCSTYFINCQSANHSIIFERNKIIAVKCPIELSPINRQFIPLLFTIKYAITMIINASSEKIQIIQLLFKIPE